MASSAIALLLSGGFDDAESKLSSSSSSSAALRGIGGGASSLERWLSLPPSSLPPRVFLVVAAGADERRVRSFLELKSLPPALSIEVVVVEKEAGRELATAAGSAAASSLSSPSCSLVVADAAAVPVGLDLARLRAAASLLAAPAVVASSSPLGKFKRSSSGGADEALQKTCKGLGKVSLLSRSRGSAVARVAAFGQESSNNSHDSDDEIFDAQRVAFLPPSSLESAAKHSGNVRSWLCAQGPNLRALVSASPLSSSSSAAAAASSTGGGCDGPLPHASTAAGRALAATLLTRGGGGWSKALPAIGAEAWLVALVASSAAGDDDDDTGFELEEEEERRPESSSTGLAPLPKEQQHSSFSTTSSAYGSAAPPAVAAALAAAATSLRRGGGGGGSYSASSAAPSSASPRKPSLLLPPLSPVLKTGSSGAAGGTLRFDIPRSRVHDKLDA